MSQSKVPFAIVRVKKLSKKSLGKVHAHNNREMPVLHAKNGVENICWTHDGSDRSTGELVEEKLDQYPDMRIQKNSVVAVEVLMTASPEFFEKNSKENTDKWYRESVKWLKRKFGKRVVQIFYHLDEKSPHIHGIVIPINPKTKTRRRTKAQVDNKEPGITYKVMSLCANDIFTPDSLRKMQTEYANCVKKFGLRRGLKKSGATHTKVKEYYAKIVELPIVNHKINVMKEILKNETEKVEAKGIEFELANKTLKSIHKKTKDIIDAYFYPFLRDLEDLFTSSGPQKVKRIKSMLEELDENIVKLQDDIPADITNRINKRLNTLQPKKLSLKD